MLSWSKGTLERVQKCKLLSYSLLCMSVWKPAFVQSDFCVNVHSSVKYFLPSNVNLRCHIWLMVCSIQQQQQQNMNNKLQVHSRPVTHTSSAWDWMWPHTITNNCLHSLKDFPRQKCLPYQYCPLLPPLPAVLWYHIWPLCSQGDFQHWNGEQVGNGHPTSGQRFL